MRVNNGFDRGRLAAPWSANCSLYLVLVSLLGLLLVSPQGYTDTPANKSDVKSTETVSPAANSKPGTSAKNKEVAQEQASTEPGSSIRDESDTKMSRSAESLDGAVAPLSNRSIVYGLVWSKVKVDGLQEANPLAIRFSGVRRLPKSLAVDFQLLIGPAAVSQDQNFFDVPITVKTQIVGAGVLRLQKYFTPFQDSLPNFQAILNLGYCYCVIKSTRPVPVEGEEFTYRLPFKAIDRGSLTYGVALHYRLDQKNAVTLEMDRFVDDDRLEFTGLTFGWDRAF